MLHARTQCRLSRSTVGVSPRERVRATSQRFDVAISRCYGSVTLPLGPRICSTHGRPVAAESIPRQRRSRSSSSHSCFHCRRSSSLTMSPSSFSLSSSTLSLLSSSFSLSSSSFSLSSSSFSLSSSSSSSSSSLSSLSSPSSILHFMIKFEKPYCTFSFSDVLYFFTQRSTRRRCFFS